MNREPFYVRAADALFGVPTDAPVFVVQGMDCALLRSILEG